MDTEYVVMALAALVGGIIQPLTGFGSAVILMVAASAFYDITVAPTLVALICIAQSGTMCFLHRKHVEVRKVALPIAVYTVCSLIVINLLGRLDLRTLHIAFGVFLMALAVYFLCFARRVSVRPSLTAGLACSVFSGCCAGAFTVGGPTMALYLVAAAESKEAYVADMQCLFVVTNAINVAMRLARGYFAAALLPVAAVGMVCVLAGLWLGDRLSRRMNGDVARRVVYLGVGISGLVTTIQQIF